jgi:phospholipid/cholesterol/gamma-HCH transport system substrate-binding protein
MKFRIRFVDQIAGVFTLIALAFVAFLLFLIASNQRWFAQDAIYYANFNSAKGLSKNMNINLKGFKIGTVDQIILTENNTVEVQFRIYENFVEKVYLYSLIELVSSPIGLGSELVFHPGNRENGGPIPNGNFLFTRTSDEGRQLVADGKVLINQTSDSVGDLISSVDPILAQIDNTIFTINTALASVTDIVEGRGNSPIVNILRDINTMTDRLTQSLEVIDESIALNLANVESITGNIRTTTEQFTDTEGIVQRLLDPSGSLDTLLNDDNQLFNRIDNILGSVEGSLTEVETLLEFLQESRPQLASILDKTREALDSGQEVLTGVRNNPLIRGGIPETKEQPAEIDSFREGDF